MTEEIEKLCSEISPETLIKYIELNGWKKEGAYRCYAIKKETKYTLYISDLYQNIGFVAGSEDRPILAILFDLWRIQKPSGCALTWLLKHLRQNGLEELAASFYLALFENPIPAPCPMFFEGAKEEDCAAKDRPDEFLEGYYPECDPCKIKFRDKRVSELEVHLGALWDCWTYIDGESMEICKSAFKDAKKCLEGMFPVHTQLTSDCKKKIAELEAENLRIAERASNLCDCSPEEWLEYEKGRDDKERELKASSLDLYLENERLKKELELNRPGGWMSKEDSK